MPNLDRIEAVSDELDRSPMQVNEHRCSFVRNRTVSCRFCLDFCPAGALSREIGKLHVDTGLCRSCGACALVCPTSTYLTTDPNTVTIVEQAKESAPLNQGTACFICDRYADELKIDRSRVVVIPCANYLDEYLILGLFLVGIDRVAIMRPGCEDCPSHHDPFAFDVAMDSIKRLQHDWNFKISLLDTPNVPDNLQGHTKGTPLGYDRRAAFTEARDQFVGVAGKQVESFIQGTPVLDPDRDAQTVVGLDEHFATQTYRSALVLQALRHLGEPEEGATTTSRFWGQLSIDTEKCNACGHCATFCPTDALEYEIDEDAEEMIIKNNTTVVCTANSATHGVKPASLFFTPSRCIQCHVCVDTCQKKALSQSQTVEIADLLEGTTQVLFEDELPPQNQPFGRFGG